MFAQSAVERLSTSIRHHHAYGETLWLQEIGGVRLSETAYPCGLTIPCHAHEKEAYFNLVLQGHYTEHCGRRQYELGRASLIFHSPDEARSNRFQGRRTRLFNVRLDAVWLQRIPEHAQILKASALFNGGCMVQLAQRLYQESMNPDAASPLVVEGLILEMLGEAVRFSDPVAELQPPRWLLRVKEMLHAQFAESLLLSQIAETAGVHPVHLNRAFRQHFRCTVGEYIRRLRVEYACHRLSATRESLAEIATAAGFSDQSHFSRTFKRQTGLTPALYRATFCAR